MIHAFTMPYRTPIRVDLFEATYRTPIAGDTLSAPYFTRVPVGRVRAFVMPYLTGEARIAIHRFRAPYRTSGGTMEVVEVKRG